MNPLLTTELEELYDKLDLTAEAEERSVEDVAVVLKERFCIKDLNGANWAFRKIKAMQQKIDENEALASAEQMRIADWLKAQNNKDEDTISFFTALLTDYFQSERKIDPKFKLSTPYGEMTSRKSDKWEYDEEVLVKSLKDAELTEYIKITELPMKAEIKRNKAVFLITELGTLATRDGDVIDGVTVTNGETISVKVE